MPVDEFVKLDTSAPAATTVTSIPNDALETQGVLGYGNYAIVHLARWHGLEVAVKKAEENLDDDMPIDDAMDLLHDELKIMRDLNHANVVRLLAFVGDESQPSKLVLEYAAKGSLEDLGQLDTRQGWEIARDVSQGLAYLHGKRIIHCDLKPGNILLDAKMKAKICDFGLSEQLSPNDSFVKTGKLTGTPAFIAPESLRHTKYYPASDVYSFSVILWEMASGREFCQGIKTMEVLQRKIVENAEREPISETTPAPIADLIKRGWAAEPKHRPTAAEISAKLGKFLATSDSIIANDSAASSTDEKAPLLDDSKASSGAEDKSRLCCAII